MGVEETSNTKRHEEEKEVCCMTCKNSFSSFLIISLRLSNGISSSPAAEKETRQDSLHL
jgi:hypothetical protein